MRKDPLAFLSTELDNLKQQGLYRKLRVLEGKPESHTTYDHKSVVNLSSNNYLGLTTHPKLKQAALDAVEKFGVGIRRGAHHLGNHGNAHGARAAARHVQARRIRRRVPERLRRECRAPSRPCSPRTT